jgi:hypothetical protein
MIMYGSNKHLALSLFWILLGGVLLGLSMAKKLDSELYAGMGGALIGVGVLQLIRTLRYRRDADYREKLDTETNDERNRFLRMKSWAWTGYLVVLLEGIGSVIALVLGRHELQQMLSCSLCLIVGTYWVVYLILSRRY